MKYKRKRKKRFTRFQVYKLRIGLFYERIQTSQYNVKCIEINEFSVQMRIVLLFNDKECKP